jgi:hypothetical protein
MKSFSWGIGLAGLLAVCLGVACSSSDSSTGCDSSKCAPHNECIALSGVTQCRRTCSSNTDPAEACPHGYTCVQHDPKPFCEKDNVVFPTSKGQWGSPCNPSGGYDHNPDCDTANGFICYGTSPTDATAYCTQYGCTGDRDCAATYWCATINVYPDVTTTHRKVGAVTSACLKHTYCSPCTADFDCPTLDGKAQHCIGDDNGASFCSPECGSSDNCNLEARCADFGDFKACYPRAGVCVGDGALCSPCRSDADCGDDGACLKGQYTTEHACGKKSPSGCDGKGGGTCPAPGDGAKVKAICLGGAIEEVPTNFCAGYYPFGSGGDVGCFTPAH